jgi:hypothetical protein
LKEQQSALRETEVQLQRAKDSLKELETLSMEGGVEQQLQRLEEEVKTNTFLIQRLPQEIAEKRERSQKLREVLNQPTLSDSERISIQNQIQTLRNEVKKLQAKRDSSTKCGLVLCCNADLFAAK